MTPEGYRARIAAIEWHARLWLPYYGRSACEALMAHCSECVEADFYGCPRPEPQGDVTSVELLKQAEILFDACVFSGGGPQSFE